MAEAERKDVRRSKPYRELRRSLLENLKRRGLDCRLYQDKVDEYMDFWKLHKELQRDIEERGMVVFDDRGRVSENRSISLDIQVSRQMLALFTSMGFKPEEIRSEAGEDNDDL